jgi:hypothetical protein
MAAEEGAVSLFQLNTIIFGKGEGGTIFSDAQAIIRALVFSKPGWVIALAWPYLFGIAGLILFVMLVWGSMEIFLAAGNSKLAESGKKRMTSALIGFLLLFAAFWIGQIFTSIFGLDIGLGTSTP